MNLQQDISLRPYNTFGIDVRAKYFSVFQSIEELQELFNHSSLLATDSRLILGGGSNILFTGDFEGIVLKNEISGIKVIREDEDYIYVQAGGGVNWHQFVLFCIKNNYAGAENLSLIPGSAGASPMQNIGAYGVEIKDIFHQLEAYHIGDKTLQTFSLEDCAFGYRDSVFKRQYKNQFVILNVTYRLRKKPVFHITYGAIQQELEKMGVEQLSIQAISQAVINIRTSKLPDPKQIGNAGSFFKNPAIVKSGFYELKQLYPNIPSFPVSDEYIKLPAGWLIEQCGWKGYRKGDVGCYEKQALVLVNYGHATGKEIYQLSEEIIQSVKEKFNIELEREVNII